MELSWARYEARVNNLITCPLIKLIFWPQKPPEPHDKAQKFVESGSSLFRSFVFTTRYARYFQRNLSTTSEHEFRKRFWRFYVHFSVCLIHFFERMLCCVYPWKECRCFSVMWAVQFPQSDSVIEDRISEFPLTNYSSSVHDLWTAICRKRQSKMYIDPGKNCVRQVSRTQQSQRMLFAVFIISMQRRSKDSLLLR